MTLSIRWACFIACWLVLTSCSQAESYNVEIASYNYMNKPVFNYSVDGTPGGNALYGATDAGSGWACCLKVTVGRAVDIRWSFRNERGHHGDAVHEDESRARVVVPGPVGTRQPRFIEVHIYSQDHIELRLVSTPGAPRWPTRTWVTRAQNAVLINK